MFSYDSRHKIILGALIILWAAWHFLMREPAQERYANGQVKRSGGQVDDLNQGTWTWYHENGRKQMEGSFEHGKRTGTWTTFASNGDTLAKARYDRDRLNGATVEYGPGNRPLRTVLFREDVATDTLPAP